MAEAEEAPQDREHGRRDSWLKARWRASRLYGKLTAKWALVSFLIATGLMVVAILVQPYWYHHLYSAIVPVMQGIAGSLYAVSVALVVYELKRKQIEDEYHRAGWQETVNSFVTRLEPWLPSEFVGHPMCGDGKDCPDQVRRLGRVSGVVLGATGPLADFKREFLLRRVERIANQVETWGTEGNWPAEVITFADGGRRFCPTDADLAYELVSSCLLRDFRDSWVCASTIFPYMSWWLTWPGLYYLESQREHNAKRTFLFPYKVIVDLFTGFTGEHATREERDHHSTFQVLSNKPFLSMTQWVLCLHWCLGIEVKVLSPKMIDPNMEQLVGTAEDRWAKWDLAIFGRNQVEASGAICAIELQASGNAPSEALTPKAGGVVAEPGSIRSLFTARQQMAQQALDFTDVRNAAKANKQLAAINDGVTEIFDILGYGENDRTSPPQNRKTLTTVETYEKLRQKIGLPI